MKHETVNSSPCEGDAVPKYPELHGRVQVVTRFDYQQVVWFLDRHALCSGKIVGIRAEQSPWSEEPEVHLHIEVFYGPVSTSQFVDQKHVFTSRDALIDHLLRS